ncbi:MAG: substrate-binding domain-containing protein [Chloroflexota bacterium]|nr:substrate-binding domain-containing protein [Chloroflexota bacterium]
MDEVNQIKKSNIKKIFFLICLIPPLIITSCLNYDYDQEINIFAAAYLSGPLDKIKDNYKESINIDYDGSFSLINKINLGASPDIVIIAGLENIELVDENLNKIISIKHLIKNELVLIYKDKFGDSLYLKEVCNNQEIIFGVADPLLAPLGKQSHLIMNKYENCRKLLEEKNLRISSNAMTLIGALDYGHLDAAIIYKSDYINGINNPDSFKVSGDNLNETIYYLVLEMGNNKNNKLSKKEDFIDYLFSDNSRELFDEFGFEMVTDDFK